MKNSTSYALTASGSQQLVTGQFKIKVHNARGMRAIEGTAKVALALLCSAMAAWPIASALSIGFDVAWDFVATLLGYGDLTQGVLAAIGLWFMTMPAVFAVTIALFQKLWNGGKIWNYLPMLSVGLFGTLYLGLDIGLQGVLEVSPWMVAAMFTAWAAKALTTKLINKFQLSVRGLLAVSAVSATLSAALILILD
jgi:hypothetical protein